MMYHVNTIPGEVAARMGYAAYPEDFRHHRPRENFTTWRTGGEWEIETTLKGEALLE